MYSEPVHVRQEGQWVEIDTDLVPAQESRVAPRTGAVDVSIATDGADQDLVKVGLDTEGKQSVGWGLASASSRPGEAGRARPVKPQATAGQVDGSSMTFSDVVPQAGLELSVTATGVKENVILQDSSAPTSYTFDLDLDGLSPVEAGGGLHLLDGDGELVAAIPAGYMQDAAGEVSDDVTIQLAGTESDPKLELSIDTDWVADDAREFPVRVDPTIQLDTGVEDTHVESTRPNTNFSGYGFMRAGKQNSGKIGRGFIRFDVSQLSGKTIDYAQLEMYNQYSENCTPRTVSVYRVTENWNPNTTYWPGPQTGEKVGSAKFAKGSPGCPSGSTRFWISQMVRDWTSGAVDNHGVSLRAVEDASYSTMRRMATSEVPDTGQRPYPNVSWREALLGNLGYYTMNSQELTDRAQMHLNVANGNLLIQHADVQLDGVAGTGLNIGRYYNSREDTINPNRVGQTGAGWTLDVGSDIRFSVNGYDEAGYFEGPSGYRTVFPYNHALGVYEQPAGLNARVETNHGYDYTVHMVDSGMLYHFDGGPTLDAIEDQRGNTIDLAYASDGETLTSITDTKGDTTTFDYNSDGLVTTITGPDGRTMDYAYDGLDLVSSTDFAGDTTSYDYDTEHNMVAYTDPRGGTTGFSYNTKGELVENSWADSTPANPKVTTYDRSTPGQVEMTDPNGNDGWKWTFDNDGRLEEFLSPRANEPETYDYNPFNSVQSYTNNTGGIGTLSYDGYNVESIQSDNGATFTFEYTDSNTSDRPSKFTNAQGNTLEYEWGNSQDLTKVTGSDGQLAQMTYRSPSQSCTGSLAQAEDGRGQVTTYTYDSRCRMTKINRPAPMGDTTLSYDSYDRVSVIGDARGVTQFISYDANDRVTKISYSRLTPAPGSGSGPDKVLYSYDGNGNRTQRADYQDSSTPATSTWQLDDRNRVLEESLPEGENTYTYDKAGNLATLTNDWGTTSYDYDAENDVTSIAPPVGSPITFDYHEHTYAAVQYPGNVTDAQHYDTDGRIQQIDQWRGTPLGGSATILTDLRYDYNNTDSVHSITDDDYDLELEYTYDDRSRIATSYGKLNTASSAFQDNSYDYDANSNRTSWEETSSGGRTSKYVAQYNNADQLTGLSKKSTTLDDPVSTENVDYNYDEMGTSPATPKVLTSPTTTVAAPRPSSTKTAHAAARQPSTTAPARSNAPGSETGPSPTPSSASPPPTTPTRAPATTCTPQTAACWPNTEPTAATGVTYSPTTSAPPSEQSTAPAAGSSHTATTPTAKSPTPPPVTVSPTGATPANGSTATS